MKNVVLSIVSVSSFFGALGGAIALRFSFLTIIILSILNIFNLINIPWFASIGVLSAVGTGLWMFVIGLLLYLFGLFITFVAATSMDI